MNRFLLLSLAFCSLPSPTHAESPGTSGAAILKTQLGARAAGMSGAFAAVADDVYAISYNPAGLSLIRRPELGLMFLKGLEDTSLSFAAYSMPIPSRGLWGLGPPTLAAAILSSDQGEIEVNRTDPDGSLRDSRTIKAGSDFVFSLAYSEILMEGSLPATALFGLHYVGLGAKFIRSTLAEEFSASAFAMDMGYLGELLEGRLRVGAAVLNLGSKLKFIEEGDPLPMQMVLGASYRWSFFPDHALRAAMDLSSLIPEKSNRVRLGAEYEFQQTLALRAGFQSNQDLGGLTFGVGLKKKDLGFDYALETFEDLSDAHRISLSYRFGKPTTERDEPSHPESYPPAAEWEPAPTAPTQQEQEPLQPGIPGWEY